MLYEVITIPHGTVTLAGDGEERRIIGLDALLQTDVLELTDNIFESDPPEIVTLTARNHCRRQAMRFGGREDEDRMRRRFLQCFQQRVERPFAEHVP